MWYFNNYAANRGSGMFVYNNKQLIMNKIIVFCTAVLMGGISACAQPTDEKKNPNYNHNATARLLLTDAEWKKVLSAKTYNIMREEGTEAPGTGPYVHNDKKGMYYCAACGNLLFSSDSKFDSHTGWPSFYQAANMTSIATAKDESLGMVRDEVRCARCNGHLGHVFDDGPQPTGLRYCMNGYALMFEEKK